MNSLYTPAIRDFVRSRPWPKRLRLDVVEYPEYLGFRFYRDNFVTFNTHEQEQIAMAVKDVMETLRKQGIPCYLEKV